MRRGDETLIFGDGLQTRDFVFVGDVVAGMLAAAEARGGVFNIGTGTETSVRELHRMCAGIAGVDGTPRFEAARLGEARRSVLDVSNAASGLGWRATTPLEEGLRQTWGWLTQD
jgi:UDP-glucose 4-epimerase